ncbi:phosphotransferase family protein [Sporosarcina sp. CAU 1771]
MNKFIKEETIDWAIVENYLRNEITDFPNGELKIKQFSAGYSNLTYLLSINEWEGVLRRPPFGFTPPRAHDMKREYDILQKVNPVFSKAPKPYVYCEDEKIMDKHFYVMEKKQGLVIDDKLPEEYKGNEAAPMLVTTNLIQTLVELHSIDYKQADMSSMGKPEGYLERQVNGWIQRYGNSKTDGTPQVAELENWFIKNLPENQEATIVHNDFKLNNMLFSPTNTGEVLGVLDWELCTIGDPLTDLGSAISYWGQPGEPDIGVTVLSDQPGFPNRREFVEQYSNLSGRDVSDVSYYLAFGFYKLAGVLQQLFYRWKIGEMNDERFSTLDQGVKNLIEMADLARQNRLL